MKALLLLCFFIGTVHSSDKDDYQEAVKLLNGELKQAMKGRHSCPGLSLVVSCGNQKCEASKGEDVNSCPADCLYSPVKSYNKQTICENTLGLHRPYSTLEVSQIVKNAYAKGEKIKVVGTLHSATGIICSEGHIISTENLNHVLGLENVGAKEYVNVEPGVTVFALSEWLHKRGKALAGIPHMGFRDLTVAGAIATGSHGSSPKHTGVISNIVDGVEFVDGLGNIRTVTEKDPEIKALRVSLGMLGITTKLKLRIQDQFNLEVKVSFHHEDLLLGSKNIHDVVADCDYGQLNWFPGTKKFMKTCGKKTKKSVHKKANNELLNPSIPDVIVDPFKVALQYGACHNSVMCSIEAVRYLQFVFQPPLTKKGIFGIKMNSKKVRGPSHRMVSSHLTPNQEGFFQMDWEIALPQSTSMDALKFVKSHIEKNKICLPLVGVFIRFAKIEDKTLLAHSNADGVKWKVGDIVTFLEMPVYLPVGFNAAEKKSYDLPFESFASTLVSKYSGRAHWGKNRMWIFEDQKKLGTYMNRVTEFQKQAKIYDPKGLFKNSFSAKAGL
ncbi:MAG: FAD-binding protein [Bacteriovoracaceae bacterium]|jgi:hypothetical protein|nr:FAD-binding protein [Bacteriovoracaceae bacterium]